MANGYAKNLAYHTEFSKVYNINKTDFLNLFQNACENSVKINYIQGAWASTGLIPYDLELVLNKLPKEEQPITSLKQATSVIFFENDQLGCLRQTPTNITQIQSLIEDA